MKYKTSSGSAGAVIDVRFLVVGPSSLLMADKKPSDQSAQLLVPASSYSITQTFNLSPAALGIGGLGQNHREHEVPCILEKKTERTLIKYLIKFKDYETTVWQPKEKIPAFFVNQFDKTGITLIPRPKVLEERRKGTVSELILCKYWSVYNLHNTDY